MGLLYLKTGRREEAFKAFRRYLDECPACPDKEMILHMIDDGEG
jgi:hypothetical protein